MKKIDFHLHTQASADSNIRLESLLKKARNLGFTTLAITDHDSIKNAVLAKTIASNYGLEIIIGQEVKTEYGDIIGLFLTNKLKNTAFLALIDEIKKQHGLVVLPHPYKQGVLKIPPKLINEVDLIETYNARTKKSWNKKAQQLAARYHKSAIIGSDAHLLAEFGLTYMTTDTPDLKNALLQNKMIVHPHPITNLKRVWFIYCSQCLKNGIIKTSLKSVHKIIKNVSLNY